MRKGGREDGRLLSVSEWLVLILELDVQELLRVVPLVSAPGRRRDPRTLEPDQVGLQHLAITLGDLGLAHARVPLDEERLLSVNARCTDMAMAGRDVLRASIISSIFLISASWVLSVYPGFPGP